MSLSTLLEQELSNTYEKRSARFSEYLIDYFQEPSLEKAASLSSVPGNNFFSDLLRALINTPREQELFFELIAHITITSQLERPVYDSDSRPPQNQTRAETVAAMTIHNIGNAVNQPAFQRLFLQSYEKLTDDPAPLAKFISNCCTLQHGWTFEYQDNHPSRYFQDVRFFDWKFDPTLIASTPFEEFIINLEDNLLLSLIPQSKRQFQGALAASRPDLFRDYLESHPNNRPISLGWNLINSITPEFDSFLLDTYRRLPPEKGASSLVLLDHLRDGKYRSETFESIDRAFKNKPAKPFALAFLSDHDPARCNKFAQEFFEQQPDELPAHFIQQKVFATAAQSWTKGGRELILSIIQSEILPSSFAKNETSPSTASLVLEEVLKNSSQLLPEEISSLFQQATSTLEKQNFVEKREKNELLNGIWEGAAKAPHSALTEFYWKNLSSRSKTARRYALEALAGLQQTDTAEKAAKLLAKGKANARLGATELLGKLGQQQDPKAPILLQQAYQEDHTEKVKSAISEALTLCGQTTTEEGAEASLEELLKSAAKLKIPKNSFLNLEALPPLPTTEGSPLPEAGLTYLISKQSKLKSIKAHPEVAPLLAHVDREKSGDFALALYRQWLASEQSVKDRWALTFGGLLGDQRILPELIAPINDWALNSRHKLAEFAAQAIALIPGDEALTLLDSLANRYRSKFKNIGKACRAALETAAEDRGVSVDELADLIVPDLGFNSDYQRPFPDTEILAVLQPDFKLTFLNPETEKETKSPPSSLPDTAKDDLKVLRKLIRETTKSQTTRLELSLVRQRTWPLTRWQELFEAHPLLQSYASSLVWAHLNEQGELVQSFRRYPNGLLANAAGELIELEGRKGNIALLHPLSLTEEEQQAWQEHLKRMKVKPPFPQLERPTAVLDSKHANRKEVKTADKATLSCGTFRSRSEKRGWLRGSVVDGGGIWYYYKSYPGAEIDVFLSVEGMWVGQDPMEEVTLGTAMFVKGGSVQIGSYEYNEPDNSDDSRVFAFGKVPPIVYSETLTDLQAIIGDQTP